MAQRGISEEQVAMVLAYGTEQRSHGASRLSFDGRSLRRLRTERGLPIEMQNIPTHIQVVVGDDGLLITATHRTKRTRRDIAPTWTRRLTH